MTASFPLFAAVRYGRGDPVDALLEGVVRGLQAQGARVAGYLHRDTGLDGNACSAMYLEDVATGELHLISQPLGAEAKGCRLDPRALAGLCGVLEAALDGGVDILVLNRFGKGEAEGQGFRSAIEKAIVDGVPVLMAVQDTHHPAWLEFAGDYAASLPPARAEIEAWARSVLHRRGEAA